MELVACTGVKREAPLGPGEELCPQLPSEQPLFSPIYSWASSLDFILLKKSGKATMVKSMMVLEVAS